MVKRVDAFDQDRAWQFLLKQVSFGPRVPGTKAHKDCRDWIASEMKKVADDVQFQEFTHTWSQRGEVKTMWNIVATQNWEKAKTRVVLLAHWDSRPFADQEYEVAKARKPIDGANDGASGVAVLIEAARVLKFTKDKDLGIMYLFTDGEDLGPGLNEMFLGAEHFAKNLVPPKPDYGILLDMIGDKDLRIPMEPNSKEAAPKVLDAFYRYAQTTKHAKTFPMMDGPEILDDHLALNKAGIPTIDLIDFDYPEWHTLGDTPDKCSAESLGKVGDVLTGFVGQKPPFTGK